ncbi:MAG: PEP/pyruvate-binding domain-containing protein [Candidatus Thermoplasmatota archaeon]|nr:PEP/pyruvate-binding domain-containing protein [Candidatus Thermoplasmatota archaeon]
MSESVDADRDTTSSVRHMLLIASEFDRLYLEGEVPIITALSKRYSEADLGFVPDVDFASGGQQALGSIEGGGIDLALVFNPPADMPMGDLIERARAFSPAGKLAFLTRNKGVLDQEGEIDPSAFDSIFLMPEGIEIVPRIVQFMEDRSYLDDPDRDEGLSHIILLDIENMADRSHAIIAACDAVWARLPGIMGRKTALKEKIRAFERRIRVMDAIRYGGLEKALHRFGDRVSLVISDQAPIKGIPSLPPLELTEENVSDMLIPEDLVLKDEGVTELGSCGDLRGLERLLYSTRPSPDQWKSIRPWLISRTEFEIVRDMDAFLRDASQDWKAHLIDLIKERRRSGGSGSVMDFTRSAQVKDEFTRIGSGQLGGKGRGLSFLKGLAMSLDRGKYSNLTIKVPRTVVLATDVFDQFLKNNGLDPEKLKDETDERIVDLFLRSDLPSTIIGDIRHFADIVRNPVIIRSSSLLEDALFQPFAGIYASVMLSNSGHELDRRFKHISMGIKYVYASTFLKRARAYLESTGNHNADEKMAAVIQEVVGNTHGELYYPDLSGVGRSYDYWPFPTCRSEDGTVSLAVGLGKMIVDGGATFKFCPVHPRSSFLGGGRECLDRTQRRFYALKFSPTVRSNEFGEDVQIVLEDLSRAEEDGVLDSLVSTYSCENDRTYPGCGRDGPRIVDFAPILQMKRFPMAEVMKDILDASQRSLGTPVEIEFAMNIFDDGENAELYLLQLRSMRGRDRRSLADLDSVPEDEIVLRCGRTMGNGEFAFNDIIMVKGRELEGRSADALVKEIGKLNKEVSSSGRKHLLIGPGRWGSCDPWLGIPVAWNDISAVGVMVERPVGDRMIDPSQGSHFFQNISSLRLGYLTLDAEEDGSALWSALDDIPKAYESDRVMHLRSERGVRVLIDGSGSRAVMQIPGGQKV